MSQHKQGEHQEVLDYALENNLEAFWDIKDVLMLDVDSADGMKVLAENAEILSNNGYNVAAMFLTKSKSGRDHVYIQLKGAGLTAMRRLALQACLGSDRKHELLNFMILEESIQGRSNKKACYLFETPPEALRLRAWAVQNDIKL